MKKNLLFTTALVAATFSASGEGEQSNPNLIFDEGLSNEDLKEGIEFANSAEGNLALKDNLLYNYDKSKLKDGKLGISKKDAAAVSADLIKSGIGVNQAGVLAAFTAGQSRLIASDAITHEFSNSLQRGQHSLQPLWLKFWLRWSHRWFVRLKPAHWLMLMTQFLPSSPAKQSVLPPTENLPATAP